MNKSLLFLCCLPLCLGGCTSSQAQQDAVQLKQGMTVTQLLSTVHPDVGGSGYRLDAKVSLQLSNSGELSVDGKTVPVAEFEKTCQKEKQGWLVVLKYAGFLTRSSMKLTLGPDGRLEKWEGPYQSD